MTLRIEDQLKAAEENARHWHEMYLRCKRREGRLLEEKWGKNAEQEEPEVGQQKYQDSKSKPLSVQEALDSIAAGLTTVTMSRNEWERLLLAIRDMEKKLEATEKENELNLEAMRESMLDLQDSELWKIDAERYRKLKAIYDATGRIDILCNPQVFSFEQIVDGYPQS